MNLISMTIYAKQLPLNKQHHTRVIEYSFIITHHLSIFSIFVQSCFSLFCPDTRTLLVRAKAMQFLKMKRNVVKSKIETRFIFLATIISTSSTVVRIRFIILLLFTFVHYRTWFLMSIIAFCLKKIAATALLISKTSPHCHRQICNFTSCMPMLTFLK